MRVGTTLAYHHLTMTKKPFGTPAAAWLAATSFHTPRGATRPVETRAYVDTRPRVKYLFPDGRIATVITDHGETPKSRIDLELSKSDPLWDKAHLCQGGGDRRFVWLTLAQ